TVTDVSGGADDGKPSEVRRSTTVSGTVTTESYLYSYLASPDPNAGLLANVTLRRQVNGGTWSTVRQVAYDYYDGTTGKPYGNLGDLRRATVLDGNNNARDTSYYRYYTADDQGTIGYVHGLKYAFSPASYARVVAAVGSPLTATDAQVSAYADNYYEYDSSQRVSKSVVQGSGCSVCSGATGTYPYAHSRSSGNLDYNTASYVTIETLPDGSQNVVYAREEKVSGPFFSCYEPHDPVRLRRR